VRFWDASAIVPLLVEEAATEHVLALAASDAEMLVWWGTPVECISALSRREREDALGAAVVVEAAERLRSLAEGWQEVLPADVVRTTAQRLLRVHPLRAADALQLAASIVAAENDPASLVFVCLDERLCEAAAREGFRLAGV
jgi:predicted nucleic acid-binding protein